MPFVIICRCGHRNGYGAKRCMACEIKIENAPPPYSPKGAEETQAQYAARIGPYTVEELPRYRPKGKK